MLDSSVENEMLHTSSSASLAHPTYDVIVIGAGFSGVAAAIELRKRGANSFLVLEKSEGIGGAWYESTYPGAACDIPSHFYCYSFEPNPDWSRKYSPQAEIQAYIEKCADKYGVRSHIRHGACVTEIRFNETTHVWDITLRDGLSMSARHIINGAGGLHKPSYPDIPGRETFTGEVMHSAKWNHEYDMGDKRVLMIGSAASAIQIAPELAKVVRSLKISQRTANYISPRDDREYNGFEKFIFRKLPWVNQFYRWMIFMAIELMMFPIIKLGSEYGKRAAEHTIERMERQIKDVKLREALRPDYDMGCKRILVSDDYYETLEEDNVELLTAGIERVDANSVTMKDGSRHEVDVIVYATGYDLEGHQRAMHIVGRNGVVLSELWERGAEAYNGAVVAGFPNFYFLGGPNTGVGTTSYVFMIEVLLKYVLQCIDLAGTDKLLSVKPSIQSRYNIKLQADLQHTVWAGSCKSWYKREDGRIDSLYPHNARRFKKQLSTLRPCDFDIVKTS